MEQKQTIRKRKKGAWIVLFLFGAIALLLLAMFIISKYELTDEKIDKINQEIEARAKD